jgi:hypothetical protein
MQAVLKQCYRCQHPLGGSVVYFDSFSGKEQQGREGDPRFVDANKHIDTASPAFDAGILIPNFNDAASAWPYSGSAPDIGAYEFSTTTQLLPHRIFAL